MIHHRCTETQSDTESPRLCDELMTVVSHTTGDQAFAAPASQGRLRLGFERLNLRFDLFDRRFRSFHFLALFSEELLKLHSLTEV